MSDEVKYAPHQIISNTMKPGDTLMLRSADKTSVVDIITSDGTEVRFILGINGIARIIAGRGNCDIKLNDFNSVEEAFPD